MIKGDCKECGRHTWLNKNYVCCNCEKQLEEIVESFDKEE
jgi:hypothetical protein